MIISVDGQRMEGDSINTDTIIKCLLLIHAQYWRLSVGSRMLTVLFLSISREIVKVIFSAIFIIIDWEYFSIVSCGFNGNSSRPNLCRRKKTRDFDLGRFTFLHRQTVPKNLHRTRKIASSWTEQSISDPFNSLLFMTMIK